MNTQLKSGFRVILLPGLPQGVSREQALEALVAGFGISQEKAEAFLGGKPRIIQKGLNQQQALQFQKVLKSCGLDCRLEWFEAQSSPGSAMKLEADGGPVNAGVPSGLPSCPNCGYQAKNEDDPLITAFDGMGQCPACNIILAKFGRTRENSGPDGNDGTCADDESVSPGIHPAANIPFVPAKPLAISGGLLSGRVKLFSLWLGFMVISLIGYLVVGSDSPSGNSGPSSGRHYSRQEYAAEAARMAEDPSYVSPIVEAGPPPGYRPDPVAQNHMDRIEAMDLADRQLPESWFDEADVRIEPGEIWQGTISMKLPFETADLTIPPQGGGKTVGDFMYKDMDLQVSDNPWKGKGVRIAVTGQWVFSYDFNIWVMAENGRVTGVLYPDDPSLTLEALGQIPTLELREIGWSSKSKLPADFDPVFDLVQGWGHGHRIEVGLTIEVPESLADYQLGKLTGSHAETVYLQNQAKEKGLKLPLTLGKKRGDRALYFQAGKFLP